MNLNTYRFQHCLHDFVIKFDAKGKSLRDTRNMRESHTEEFHHVNISILKLLLIIFSVPVCRVPHSEGQLPGQTSD